MDKYIVSMVLLGSLLFGCSSDSQGDWESGTVIGFDTLSGSVVRLRLDRSGAPLESELDSPDSSIADARIDFVRVSGGKSPLADDDTFGESGIDVGVGSSDSDPGVYYLMARELSQAQWQELVDLSGAAVSDTPWLDLATGSSHLGMSAIVHEDDMPAYGVSYDMIDAVLVAWNAKFYWQLRLPTHAEWEYACRGAEKTSKRFNWGDSLEPSAFASKAWVAESRSRNGVRAVDSGTQFDFFMTNMHGNVWEYVAELDGSNAALRGGSWIDSVRSAASGNRMQIPQDLPYATAGVRLIIEAP